MKTLHDRVNENDDESAVESEACKFAERRGWFVAKLMRCNIDSMPDRIFHRRGITMYIEFKKWGEEPNAKQAKRHRELRSKGIPVHVVDNLEAAHDLLQ